MRRELARRIAFTIGALLLFRLGTQVPFVGMGAPGPSFSGEHVVRFSIFALGILPYLTAAIVVRLVSLVSRRLSSLERSGERGRRRISGYTLIVTLVFTTFQAYGYASTIRTIPALVPDPDEWPVLAATASIVGGVFVLVWLSEQITRHGIGNGLALLLSVNILVHVPVDIAGIARLLQDGQVSGSVVLVHAIVWIGVIALIVFVEGARRNVGVEFAERRLGDRLLPARAAILPIKINSAGFLVPATVAPWILFLPVAGLAYVFGADTPWVAAAYRHLGFGMLAHLVLGSVAIFVLAFIYTAYVVDPEHAAKSLAARDGTIPGVAPGEATADYLDRVVSLTTVVGAVYLTVLQLIPEVFELYGIGLPYSMMINGGGALVVVCTALDIKTQVRDVSLTNPGGVRR
ncbi:preprotein translocase subunit SecY [Bradyrhizobium ottawaense]|uniref:Preprotein translocase subunit SecY n=2 Tax=Nitrobacteraceae TaxID=41294 RepID=A0ABV4FZY6_9BRAD|nr:MULTISPECIES: preprotein translocase subunit SecY [Bradyrhizobium]MDA9416158.1 preprotein translocase subunit SecY [Bradyrhizobium sp. CCBAU 25360]MDA9451546.1 preprotein translocase subunit SecY [Bradyrhizobium sp. CCBAU 21360]MDA9454724.1 preprotein translocase subunit SecY [Bradyrhizobium sp. CCBAU 21359]MBR1291235.1 preprotein translocase subunit SecY [Bradyrhizobium ottawaense]MBR1362515.1 preprotein translocase subunit SecY [Bradyrhizobium ottawaense]